MHKFNKIKFYGFQELLPFAVQVATQKEVAGPEELLPQ